MPQYQTQFDYEWMDAAEQTAQVFKDWLPVLQGYGLVPSNDAVPSIAVQPVPPAPMPPQPQQPAPSLTEILGQIPPWVWALGGVAIAALFLRK